MNVLVTGSAGFIGFFLAHALAKRKDIGRLYLVDNFIRGNADKYYMELINLPNVVNLELDLSEPSSYDELPESVDIIFHFAALNGTQNFYKKPFEVIKHSSIPTYFLIEKYVTNGKVKKFIYASSSEVYASTVDIFDWEVPTNENVPLCIADSDNPRWSYAASKLWGEVLVASTCKQFKIPYLIIRYHNVYGPRMGDKHVIPDFLSRVRNKVFKLYGYDNTRSFIYITDAIKATIGLMENVENEVINIGSDEEIKIIDLAKKILDILNISAEIELLPAPKGSVNRRCPDISKLKKLITFEPEVSLEDGLKKTIQYYLYDKFVI